MNLEQLKYPIGDFEPKTKYSKLDTRSHIRVLAKFPKRLKSLTAKLSDEQLAKTYRPDGWTIRQVVHHLADSHINMFTRVRFALTEDNPTIKGYDEASWALLSDHTMPVKASLQILEGLHERMVYLFKSLSDKDLKKTYFHAGYNKSVPIVEVIALYAWHSEHHYQHIINALKND